MLYRPDIDGLRGMAVLAVVAYHAFPGLLPGGFLGVDVFFVVSGYLITRLVRADIERGTFSVADFYARRIRRIFPALVTVGAATLVGGAFLLAPHELREVGKQTLGGAGFVANFVFWSDTGYFDTAAETKPLLHLWSLGVEEQFYILWPLLLLALSRSRALWCFVLLAAASLAFGYVADSASAFYMPHARAWELVAGAAVAIAPFRVVPAASAAGLAAVLVALVAARPGPAWALLVVAGTATLLAAGASTWTSRLMSTPTLRQFGAISFSLYLWHWPLLAYARIAWGSLPPIEIRAALIAAAVLLAGATYAAIEQPARRLGNVGLLMVLMTALAAAGYMAQSQGRLPLVEGPRDAIAGDVGQGPFYDLTLSYPTCEPRAIFDSSFDIDGKPRCRQSKAHPTVAVIGDSFSEQLFPGLAEAMPEGVVYYNRSGAPLISKPDFAPIFEHVFNTPELTTVILAAKWHSEFDTLHLEQTIADLKRRGKTVYLVEDNPEFSFEPEACKFARLLGRAPKCSEAIAMIEVPNMRAVADRAGVPLFHLSQLFCEGRICSMVKDGRLLYRDWTHLNLEGSRYVGRWLSTKLRPTMLPA